VQQQRNKWQDIIIDAGGRDSTALRAALILSDVLLVPFAPRSYDVWALDDMARWWMKPGASATACAPSP
jgi:chromosome partitioning protein